MQTQPSDLMQLASVQWDLNCMHSPRPAGPLGTSLGRSVCQLPTPSCDRFYNSLFSWGPRILARGNEIPKQLFVEPYLAQLWLINPSVWLYGVTRVCFLFSSAEAYRLTPCRSCGSVAAMWKYTWLFQLELACKQGSSALQNHVLWKLGDLSGQLSLSPVMIHPSS